MAAPPHSLPSFASFTNPQSSHGRAEIAIIFPSCPG